MIEIEKKLYELAVGVRDGKVGYGPLSTGEQMAVDLVLNRPGYIKAHGTILQAIDRLGWEWVAACINIQKALN
jgi:hypothetical protein